jgi:hypothetical protein
MVAHGDLSDPALPAEKGAAERILRGIQSNDLALPGRHQFLPPSGLGIA